MLESCMPEFVLSQSKETKTDMDVFAPTGGGQFSKWFEISLLSYYENLVYKLGY